VASSVGGPWRGRRGRGEVLSYRITQVRSPLFYINIYTPKANVASLGAPSFSKSTTSRLRLYVEYLNLIFKQSIGYYLTSLTVRVRMYPTFLFLTPSFKMYLWCLVRIRTRLHNSYYHRPIYRNSKKFLLH
jgi:hypothetical protein